MTYALGTPVDVFFTLCEGCPVDKRPHFIFLFKPSAMFKTVKRVSSTSNTVIIVHAWQGEGGFDVFLCLSNENSMFS
jgi:hypothetical protein